MSASVLVAELSVDNVCDWFARNVFYDPNDPNRVELILNSLRKSKIRGDFLLVMDNDDLHGLGLHPGLESNKFFFELEKLKAHGYFSEHQSAEHAGTLQHQPRTINVTDSISDDSSVGSAASAVVNRNVNTSTLTDAESPPSSSSEGNVA